MTQRIPPEETHGWLKAHFERQRDIGLGKTIENVVFSPRNPFDPKARRSPRPGFVFSVCLFVFAVGWFSYFNFVR